MNNSAQSQLVQTPWAGSWIATVRPGALDDLRLDRRAGAWAAWALDHVTEMTSRGRRYLAVTLDGEFYDPQGRLAGVRPHLEIPQWLLGYRDETFPLRLALAGNGLGSSWWVPAEVFALRRALMTRDGALDDDARRRLETSAAEIRHAVYGQLDALADHFDTISDLLAQQPATLSDLLAQPADSGELAGFWTGASGWTAAVEPKLAEKEGRWLARRATTWLIGDGNWTQPVLLPRLTRRSFVTDPLWAPSGESPLALLVRGVVANRLLGAVGQGGATVTPARRGHLRAQPARDGSSLPRASIEAATGFLAAFDTPEDAFTALSGWAQKQGGTLSVEPAAFRAAWLRARRHIDRAEDPARADVDTVLPLVWDGKRLVRASWVTS